MLHQVFIASDGTARTAGQALKAALIQFEDTKVETHIRPKVRNKKQVREIIKEAHRVNGLVVHTVVSKKLRDFILEEGRLHDVDTIDLMGPLLAQLSHHFSDSPSEKPGVFHKLNKAYFQRIEAVEFTFRHDDGQRVEELKKSDIVLLGVSRTFKTPVSIYLAYRGWKVANVPIILDMELPGVVFEVPPERVFCLTTFPEHLADLRIIRATHLGGSTGEYATLSYIKRELEFARRTYAKEPKWSMVDVTNKPVEEISSEILDKLRAKK